MSKINFQQIIDDTQALAVSSAESFHINNVVGKVDILSRPQDSLSLGLLARRLGGMIKYAPRTFAAATLRVRDYIGNTTSCLVYSTGKLVVVGAVSKYHSLYACQNYRRIIAAVCGIEDRVFFLNWIIRNIQATDNLGFRINLKAIAEDVPELANWIPDLFPGLRMTVWMRPKHLCCCEGKCKCFCTAVLFDSGKFNLVGLKNVEDALVARRRVREAFTREMYEETADEVPRALRCEARRRKIWDAAYIQFSSSSKGAAAPLLEEENLLARLLADLPLPPVLAFDDGEHYFVRACLLGQAANVATILQFDRSRVGEALSKRARLAPEIVALLEEKK